MNNQQANQGMVVSITYVLKDKSGKILDQSSDPLEYLHGYNNIVIGLEKEITGMTIGEKKNVVVSPEEGYGQYNEANIQSVPKSAFPGDLELEVGGTIYGEDENGAMPFVVKEIQDTQVILDGNHPLAGQTLYFDIEVSSIRPAKIEEIEHGPVHNGNHHH